MTTLHSLKSTIVILLATLFAVLKFSSSSSTIENDAQMQLIKFLTERVDALQSRMDQLVAQLEGEQMLKEKIDLLYVQNVQQDEEINQLKKKLHLADTIQPNSSLDGEDRKMKINSANNLISGDSSPRLPPSSCRQLSTIGHYLDGIYLIANQDTNKIETVYCDFGSSTLTEIFYGGVDVKTKSVHFFVQLNGDFALENTVIRFDTQLLNEGDAMNLVTGIFTVPVDGIYHFDFKGIKSCSPSGLRVFLQVNGVSIGEAFAGSECYAALSGIGASLRLKTGDQVRLYKAEGIIHDYSPAHFTFFTGWLVEEDLNLLV